MDVTYVTWAENTEIKEPFFKACLPSQTKEKLWVVDKPIEVVERLKIHHDQKGIVLAAGLK